MSRRRVLVIDDLPIYREPIALALESEGYRVICAENGREALRQVESNIQAFDLFIVDYLMPEMDGIAFLKRARNYPDTKQIPAIMLTDMADKEIVVQAAVLGVRDYVLKASFSLPDLLKKVKLHCSPTEETNSLVITDTPIGQAGSSVAQTLHETISAVPPIHVLQAIKKFLERNPIPQSVSHILALSESDDANGSVLTEAVKAESFLAIQVLKLANSTTYSRVDRKISDIREAISIVGFSAIRSLVTGAHFCKFGLQANANDSYFWERSRHAVAVARIMEGLLADSDIASHAHLVGLCHELPETALQLTYPDEYAKTITLSRHGPIDFFHYIKEIFGVPFIDVAREVLEDLKLPMEIAEPILLFYGGHANTSQHAKRLAQILRIAHSFANASGYYTQSDRTVDVFEAREVQAALNRKAYQLELNENFHREVEDSLAIILPNGVQAEKQQTHRIALRVTYCRDTAILEADPLGLFLTQNYESVSSIPMGSPMENTATIQAVVVALANPGGRSFGWEGLAHLAKTLGAKKIPIVCCIPPKRSPPEEGTYKAVTFVRLPVSIPLLLEKLKGSGIM